MSDWQDALRSLTDALQLSPDNVPLRAHIGTLMLKRGMLDEAQTLYRQGLELAPESEELKLGLAQCFYQQGKHSAAIVIVEELGTKPTAKPAVHLLHAKLLLKSGQIDRAARAYRRAVQMDPQLADDELAELLNINPDDDGTDDTDWDREEVDEFGRVRAFADDGPVPRGEIEIEKPKVNFADVGGMEKVKQEIRLKIIEPLNHPELYKAYGKAIGGGILMYGPPGCGKTHLARATAGEVKAAFISVGIHDVLEMWIGSSEQRLHAIFEQARRQTPCVLFFDEVDALGASRTDMRQSAGRQLINQFLAELDGVNASNEGVLILAATNAPWHLDSAFRRPGRFDRIIFAPPPDTPARAAILQVLLRGKPLNDVDYQAVAGKTDGFSGADLKALVDVAVEGKLSEALKTGVPAPLTTKDLIRAARQVKPSTREWFASARNYAMYSNEGGRYDDILEYLKMK